MRKIQFECPKSLNCSAAALQPLSVIVAGGCLPYDLTISPILNKVAPLLSPDLSPEDLKASSPTKVFPPSSHDLRRRRGRGDFIKLKQIFAQKPSMYEKL